MDGVGSPRQLALALDHRESFARDDFLEGSSNEAGLAFVSRWPDWPERTFVLVGPEGSGKSHLAAIWAAEAGARFVAARALEHTQVPTALATGALVVEDVDESSVDERAMFHLLNLAREEGAYVLLTARKPPGAWTIALRDLASRLRALPVAVLAPPDDALLRAVIVKLCADRQLPVDESLVTYLMTRIDRSFAAVRKAVERLDHEALRQKRPVTRALASALFRDQQEP
jgi:chromosomal replication initiation ATPase DnaA